MRPVRSASVRHVPVDFTMCTVHPEIFVVPVFFSVNPCFVVSPAATFPHSERRPDRYSIAAPSMREDFQERTLDSLGRGQGTEPTDDGEDVEEGLLTVGDVAFAVLDEHCRLRREVAELRMDREFLKKAAAFFAAENTLNPSGRSQ